ncbi:MAG TPA: lysylphosphatidylglycerol synthase domain-containing protein [Kofleriaceae bacterium]
MIGRLLELARLTSVRIVVALCGIATALMILRGLGWSTIGTALVGAASYLPLLIALDACVVTCSMLALRSLYGDTARAIPLSQLVRAGVVGYAVQGLVPAGRAVAEVTRAAQLARWVGAGTAAAAATRMQAVVLIAGGAISIPTAVAAYRATGPSWIPLAIAIHGVVAFAIGSALLGVANRSAIGAWLGRRVSRAKSFGNELDGALARTSALPLRAIAWELTGRCVQVVQNAVLIVSVGGALRVGSALCSEGIHLVGAAVGDLVPGQLGVQEGNFTIAAPALGLSAAGAVSIALLAHLTQLVWVLVGSLVTLIWRPKPRDVTEPLDLLGSPPRSTS